MEFPGRVKLVVEITLGAAGAVVARLPEAVIALILLMFLDIASGFIAAGIHKKLSSAVSWQGIGRKTLVLLTVATAAVIERYLDLDLPVSFTTAIALFYCAHEGLSILENVAKAGVPIPRALRDALARLNGTQEQQEARERRGG